MQYIFNRWSRFNCALSLVLLLGLARPIHAADYLSPAALVAAPNGQTLYVAGQTGNQVLFFDVAAAKVTKTVNLPSGANGMTISKDGARLYVACGIAAGKVCVVNTASGKVTDTLAVGHTPMSPVLSPDEKTLFVCNRYNNDIAVINLANKRELARIPVAREPYAADLTPDGAFLFVANHMHDGRADVDVVAAKVSVIDVAARKVSAELPLPNGSGLLAGLSVSPDGRHVAVTHSLARYHLPTTQLERGWMNTSAITLIDAAQKKAINTVLVDSVDSGAANPYAVAWTADSATLVVTHAGTHEVSAIDVNGLLQKLAKMPTSLTNGQTIDYTAASRIAADVPNDLSFLVGLRQRIKLNAFGPRSVAIVGKKIYTGNYFSDNLSVIDLAAPVVRATALALGPDKPMDQIRKGEFYFCDATICFQGWQTCVSCHSYDARIDALNWDLLNDGIGNPKNSKSLLISHRTPPAMSMGIRDTAETAVRSGIKHILFTVQSEEVPLAMDAWLKTLKPLPSPYLENGKLSKAAERGKRLFHNTKVGCAICHPDGLYTDLKHYDVGTQGPLDQQGVFDTPTLFEMWRTAPYLHDGSARTIQEVLTSKNKKDRHGRTSHLTPQEINDLAAFVLSL